MSAVLETAAMPARRARAGTAAGTAVLLALLCVAPASAGDAGASAPRVGAWWSLGLLGGSTLVDGRLANYQWDVRPRAAWGAQALAGRGPLALGVRAWRSGTVQVLDLPAGPVSPTVRTTTLEGLARFHVGSFAGTSLWAGASAGRLRMDYRPDHVVVASGGPGGDVIADFAPVEEWTAGTGLGLQRALLPHWTLGLAFDRDLIGVFLASVVLQFGLLFFSLFSWVESPAKPKIDDPNKTMKVEVEVFKEELQPLDLGEEEDTTGKQAEGEEGKFGDPDIDPDLESKVPKRDGKMVRPWVSRSFSTNKSRDSECASSPAAAPGAVAWGHPPPTASTGSGRARSSPATRRRSWRRARLKAW